MNDAVTQHTSQIHPRRFLCLYQLSSCTAQRSRRRNNYALWNLAILSIAIGSVLDIGRFTETTMHDREIVTSAGRKIDEVAPLT